MQFSGTSAVPYWYTIYTSANHEKSVAEQLRARQIEHFLPLYESTRRWKDRRIKVQLPLFPGYVFVRILLRDRLQTLQVPGVSRFISFGSAPVVLPDLEIEALRAGAETRVRMAPHPYLTVGRRVRVRNGPFAGVSGVLLRRKGKLRVVISIDLIQKSLVLDADAADVEAIV